MMKRQSCLKRGSSRPVVVYSILYVFMAVIVSGIFMACALPFYVEAQTRSKVARTRADLRTFTFALEAYKIDNQEYPFELPRLTTPVAYLSHIPLDPFLEGKKLSYSKGDVAVGKSTRYYYLMWSVGPNGMMDLSKASIPRRFSEGDANGREAMFADVMYNPTNGARSGGDMFRIGEYQASSSDKK